MDQDIVKRRRNIFKTLPDITKNNILNAFDRGETLSDIADLFGISRLAITKFIKNNNRIVSYKKTIYDHVRIFPFTDIQKQVLVGTILGDSYLTHKKQSKSLEFTHCVAQQGYFFQLINYLAPFMVKITYFQHKNNFYYWKARSCSHPDLKYFSDLFYPDGIKIIPEGLEQFLTPLSLMCWICDDGYLTSKDTYEIYSLAFYEDGNIRLKKYLYDCFNLKADIHACKVSKINGKRHFKLQFNRTNSIQLREIILPYICENMKYKVNITNFTPTRIIKAPQEYTDNDLIELYKTMNIFRISLKTKISSAELYKRLNNKVNLNYKHIDIFSDDDILNIKQLILNGDSIRSLAKKFDVSRTLINKIINSTNIK